MAYQPLLQLFQEGMNILNAYLNQTNGEIIRDGQSIHQTTQGSVSYDMLIQTIDSIENVFSQLGAFIPEKISRGDYDALWRTYDDLKSRCENVRKEKKQK